MTTQPVSQASGWHTDGSQMRATMRYYDRLFQRTAVKVLPGEYYVTDEDIALVTVLGSCVSACLRDADAGVGGMNHFMLPASESDSLVGASARYGNYAMELLVNDLLKLGAKRHRLEAKVFGGGQVLAGFTSNHVGARNVTFVRQYLQTERIYVAADDLGDIYARKVCYLPRAGQAFVRRLDSSLATDDLASETAYGRRLRQAPKQGEIELFE
jgi:chemotaxis protein CheD